MSDFLLRVRDLRKQYEVRRATGLGHEPFTAVDDVSFDLAHAGALAIVGESGSGKSTTARIIVGLERATAGQVTVDGTDWNPTKRIGTREHRNRAAYAQMVFQDPYQSLDRRQSVRSCLDEALSIHTDLDARARAERVEQLLEQVRLDQGLANSFPRALSGGQRQRVAIARALAASPKLLILDEAVAALDVSVQAQVLKLLEQIRAEMGVAFLFISHDLPVVRQVCDDIVVMRNGQIVERGTVEDVLSNPQEGYTRRLIASVPRRGWKPKRWLNTTTLLIPNHPE